MTPNGTTSPRWETYRVEADPTDRVLANRTVVDHLAAFTPRLGDAVFIRAGTVHTLGGGVVRVRSAGKQRRDLSPVRLGPRRSPDRSASCSASRSGDGLHRLAQTAVGPVTPVMEATTPVLRERLFHSEQFSVWRLRGNTPFSVGAADTPRVLVCIEGEGQLEWEGTQYLFGQGDVVLLPAEVGACSYRPRDAVSLLEVGPA